MELICYSHKIASAGQLVLQHRVVLGEAVCTGHQHDPWQLSTDACSQQLDLYVQFVHQTEHVTQGRAGQGRGGMGGAG